MGVLRTGRRHVAVGRADGQPCRRYSVVELDGTLDATTVELLQEDFACDVLGRSVTYIDCANNLSLWEDAVSTHYLTLPSARPVESPTRQRFTAVFLGAWSFYFAQCRDKTRGVPAHYSDEAAWLQRWAATMPPVSAPSSLRLFNWDGLRFAVATNVCWQWGKDSIDESFYRIVSKGSTAEPLPVERTGERNQVLGNAHWHSRFMRNPVLWRAYSDSDRLVNVERVLEVDDRDAFLRRHRVNDTAALHWFIGCAWGHHVPHATEPLFAPFNVHLLLPALQAASLTSVCSPAGNPDVPGSHHMIQHIYKSVADVVGRETGRRVRVTMRDQCAATYGEAGTWHCFPHVAFGGLTFLPRCNGPYAHTVHGAKLRESVLKQVLGAAHRGKAALGAEGITLLYLERVTTRRILNKGALWEALGKLKFALASGATVALTLTPVVFDKMPLAAQLRHVQNTDVVVAPHGQGLFNFLWLEPNSAAIEMFAPNWHTTDFANPIVAGGSYYFPYKHVDDSVTPVPGNCCSMCCASNVASQMGYNALLEGCNDSRNCDMAVHVDEMVAIVGRAVRTVLREKYGEFLAK